MKQTFAMIKPCAVARGVTSQMIEDITNAGFTIDRQQAEWLYREHAERSHFGDLVDFTISGPVVLMQLSGSSDTVPTDFRALMGPTDIAKAGPATLRGKYAEDFRRNSIHGSDGDDSAREELEYFGSSFDS